MEFERREAPYLAPTASVSSIMLQVLLALIPAALAHVWYFGPGFIFNFLIAVLAVAIRRPRSVITAHWSPPPCSPSRCHL